MVACVLVAALAAGGPVWGEEQKAASDKEEAAPEDAPPVKKPEIVKKAERFYRKITATGFYPTIRGLAAGTGIGPGLTFWKSKPFGGPVGILATAGWNPRVLLLELRLGRVPSRPGKIPDRRFTLEALTSDPATGPNYRFFAFLEARRLDIKDDRLYFTPGVDGSVQPAQFGRATRLQDESPESVTVKFDVDDRDVDLVTGYHFRRGLAAAARVGYVRARTAFETPNPDTTPELPPIPGVNDTTDFTRLRVDAIFDRRDNRNRARRGYLFYGTWLRMDQRGGTLYGYDRFELDVRAFAGDPSRRQTLAVRVFGTHDSPFEGKAVPFYFQKTLGGNHTLRSYPIFRFRGTRLLGLSAEYRLGVLRWLELAAFYDGGQVTGGVEALGTQGYRDSYGVSVRLVSKKDVIVRGFTAYGDEGWRFAMTGTFPF